MMYFKVSKTNDMESSTIEVAERLRGLRESLNISAEQMAERCQLEAQQYQQYETGHQDIPIGVLHTIAHACHIELTALLSGEEPLMHAYALTRKMQGPSIDRIAAYEYESLAANFKQRKADPFLVTVAPVDAHTPMSLNRHAGQEFNYILKGRLKLLLNGKEMILETGDSIYFDANQPHGMIALDNQDCQFLAVII